jgi:hypothetical protein
MESQKDEKTKKTQTVTPSKATKTTKERLEESMRLLQKIKDLGIGPYDPGYKAMSAKLSEWVKGGDSWSGHVDFHDWNRRAHMVLPTKPGTFATCEFKQYVF